MSITPRNIHIYASYVIYVMMLLEWIMYDNFHMFCLFCIIWMSADVTCQPRWKKTINTHQTSKKRDLLIVTERFRCHFKKFVKISYRCVSAVSNLLRVNSVIPAGIWPWVCSINHPVCQLPSPWKWWIIDSHPVCKLSVAFSMEVTDHGF